MTNSVQFKMPHFAITPNTYLPTWSAEDPVERLLGRSGITGSNLAFRSVPPKGPDPSVRSHSRREEIFPNTCTSISICHLDTFPSKPQEASTVNDVESPWISGIFSLLAAEPVEDGFTHPAEGLLEQTLRTDADAAVRWIESLLSDPQNAPVAEVLKCFGRIDTALLDDKILRVFRKALAHNDIEIRDAAVQALELWGSSNAISLLKEQLDYEQTPWLREYIERVVRDLEEDLGLRHGIHG